MEIELVEHIGKAEEIKAPVRTWKQNASHFQSAANAAFYYAKKHKEDFVVIPGNSYGSLCYHISHTKKDLKYFTVCHNELIVGLVKPNGDIYKAKATEE